MTLDSTCTNADITGTVLPLVLTVLVVITLTLLLALALVPEVPLVLLLMVWGTAELAKVLPVALALVAMPHGYW